MTQKALAQVITDVKQKLYLLWWLAGVSPEGNDPSQEALLGRDLAVRWQLSRLTKMAANRKSQRHLIGKIYHVGGNSIYPAVYRMACPIQIAACPTV